MRGLAGTTSACAENTLRCGLTLLRRGNYLRVRGEYPNHHEPCPKHQELPPRARRILHSAPFKTSSIGTTSACAENTHRIKLYRYQQRNYLRVRGEYSGMLLAKAGKMELPPRARRILAVALQHGVVAGTTSACAENTLHKASARGSFWNYLRVRGEYWRLATQTLVLMELPPRARRILRQRTADCGGGGTTSACAENTDEAPTANHGSWNYLRVRGEYAARSGDSHPNMELPPRARRILTFAKHSERTRGTTSACAENTTPAPPENPPGRNYLRVRGEYAS